MPSENVVKWYGGVVQVAPASEVNYISTLRQFLRQSSSPGRCGVTLADCCCGSRDVAASHSQTAVRNSPLSSGGASVVQASIVNAVEQNSILTDVEPGNAQGSRYVWRQRASGRCEQ